MNRLVAAVAVLLFAGAACTSTTAGSGAGSGAPSSHAPLSTLPPSVVPTQPASSSAPTESVPASTGSGSSSGTATEQTVLRPVTAAGAAAPGWTVQDQATPIYCTPAEASPVAVDAGIAYCSPSAAFAIACWAAGSGHALCAVDPVRHILARYPLSGGFAAAGRPAHPAPFTMTLADGTSCTIRDGGTGENLTNHPDWAQYYFCTGETAVFAPPNGTGVNMASSPWTVEVAPASGEGDVHAVPVRTATFVGTAGR